MRSAVLQDAVAMILAGGQGERLYPLTRDRAKPAVPFGGAYRIIDFTLSNCLNTGLSRIIILTQYRSVSLHRHVQAGWSGYFLPALNQFIDLVPPQQRTHSMWYRGTADAIYQNIYLLEQERPSRVLVLSGDHVYRMDYGEMLRRHLESGASATVGCIEVPREQARRFGVMAVDADQRILSFEEKPAEPKAIPGRPDNALASMGIYLFETELLVRWLYADARSDTDHDFGKNVIPSLVHSDERVYAFPFHEPGGSGPGYWRDIGTLESFYEANMDLLKQEPPLRLEDPEWPIRTYDAPSPPAKIESGDGVLPTVDNVLLSPGCLVRGAYLRNSIISRNVVIEKGARVEDSILFSDVRVGAGARVTRAIVDKHVRIPPGDEIDAHAGAHERGMKATDSGILVVPKGMVLS